MILGYGPVVPSQLQMHTKFDPVETSNKGNGDPEDYPNYEMQQAPISPPSLFS